MMFKFITKMFTKAAIKKVISILLLALLGYVIYVSFFEKEPVVEEKRGWFDWFKGTGSKEVVNQPAPKSKPKPKPTSNSGGWFSKPKVEEKPKGVVETVTNTVKDTASAVLDTGKNIASAVVDTTKDVAKKTWETVTGKKEEPKPKTFWQKNWAERRYDMKNAVFSRANTMYTYKYVAGMLLYASALSTWYSDAQMKMLNIVPYVACASIVFGLYSMALFVRKEQPMTGLLSANMFGCLAVWQSGYVLYSLLGLAAFDIVMFGIYYGVYSSRKKSSVTG